MPTRYKLFRMRKDGTLGPLFISAKLRVPLNLWLQAEDHPTKGFAHRPGWHLTKKPFAPHLTEKNRVWCEVETKKEEEKVHNRPESQGGEWVLAESIKVLSILSKDDVNKIREDHNV